jgi:hypothetical protein
MPVTMSGIRGPRRSMIADHRPHGGHGDEVDAGGGSGVGEIAERFAQEHQHREAHHADGHAREQRDGQQRADVGLAHELDVSLCEALHGNS